MSFVKAQGYYHGLVKTHTLLTDISDVKNLWNERTDGTFKNDGHYLRDVIIADYFVDTSNNIRDRVIVEGKAKGDEIQSLQTVVDAFKVVLPNIRGYTSPLLKGIGESKTMPVEVAKNLRTLLKQNGIIGFNLQNPDFLRRFLEDFNRFGLDKRLKGTSILDGRETRPLNSKDRAVVQHLLELGLSDADFNFIDIAGVIQSVAAVPEIKKALGGLRVSSSSVAYTLKGKFKLHRLGLKELDTNNPLRKAIEDIVGGSKIDGDTLFRD